MARILVLEDDDNLRAILAEVLEDEGYQVTAVDRGESAVEMAQSAEFDLILADIRMEGIGGLEAIEQTQRLQPEIGSMIVSGYATEAETARAERLEVGAYLTKPFKMQEMLAQVRTILASRGQNIKEEKAEDLFRVLLDWSLDTAAEMADESDMLDGSLSQAARVAEELARKLGFPPDVSLECRWATLMHGLSQLPEAALPESSQRPSTLLPVLTQTLAALGEAPDLDAPLEAQCARAALSAYLQGEGHLTDEVRKQLKPEVVQAFSELKPGDVSQRRPNLEERLGMGRKASSQRSLLSLARTLERLGDMDSADKAYLALYQSEDETLPSAERLEALLGRARLAVRRGDRDNGLKHAIETVKLARTQGPLALTGAGLEAVLLMQSLNSEHALSGLKLIEQATASMDLGVQRALVRCALRAQGQDEIESRDIEALTSPTSANEVARYIDWFLPFLVRQVRPTDDPLVPVLHHVVMDFPRRFLFWFDSKRLPSQQRLALAGLLQKARHLPEIVLDTLAQDPEAALRESASAVRSQQRGQSAVQIVRIHSFGQMELMAGGEPLAEKAWKTRKVKFLFALLASRWGKPFTEDLIIEVFWPKIEARSKKNLYWATTTLRGVLKQLSPELDQPLLREHDTLSLNPEFPRWHDFEEFEKLAAEGRRLDGKGDEEAALTQLRLAGRLYRGPYLEGCYYDFAVETQEKSQLTAYEVLTRAAELCLKKAEDAEALEHATRATELMEFRQEGHALKMRAQIRLGQATQAMEQFHKIESLLKNEYELEPSIELFELFQRARLGFTDA